MTADIRDLLKQAKRPERTVHLCLRADLVAEHEELDRRLQQAQRRPADSLAGGGTTGLAERIEALEQQMAESTYPVRMRALPRHEFRDLVRAHPPRENDKGEVIAEDRVVGVNSFTFFDALLKACVVDPKLDDDEWRGLLDEKVSERQYGDLTDTAWYLNQGSVDVPFSRAASRIRRPSDGE